VILLERALPRAVEAVYRSRHERTMDVVQVDHYSPVLAEHLRVHWPPLRPLWDDPVRPEGLLETIDANAQPGLDLWVVENGLCSRAGARRADGWDRVTYLKAHLAQLSQAVAAGLPVSAYFHWTLTDNWEWGSFAPRFGLYGSDPSTGRLLDTDSFGDDAAGVYRELAARLRNGEPVAF
jgi:beta-glucosidase